MSNESREKDHANLRELAKLGYESPDPSADESSSQPSQQSREEDSGVVHLAALVASASPPSAAPPAPAPVAEQPRAKPQSTPAPRPTTRRWLTVAGLLAAAAAGAAVMHWFGAANGAPAAVALGNAPAPTSVQSVRIEQPASASGHPLPTEQPSATSVRLEPDDRPSATSDVRPPPATRGRDMEPASPPPAAARSPSPSAARAATAVDEPPAGAQPTASNGGGDLTLQAALQQAVGPTSTLAPTNTASAAPEDSSDDATHGAPLRPSVGAVDAALGATMPEARACLDPDDPISHATVTFHSDGHPANVTISGGAKGKPAEGCIRAALMKTRVGPFALLTFSVPVTIRPN